MAQGGAGGADDQASAAGDLPAATSNGGGKPQGIAGTSEDGGAALNSGALGEAGAHGNGDQAGPEAGWNLNPNEVYLWGTLREGRADTDALANVYAPNRFLLGFKGTTASTAGFLGDQLIYKQVDAAGATRQFVNDMAWNGTFDLTSYPTDPAKNDPIVPTPICTFGVNGRGADFVLTNPSKRVIYQCGAPKTPAWYEGGQQVYAGEPIGLVKLGENNLAIGHNYGIFLIDISAPADAKKLTAIVNDEITLRVRDGGFRIVEGDPQDKGAATLWQVSSDGVTQKLGVYPAPPAGIVPSNPQWGYLSGALTPDDTLLQIASRTGTVEDVVVKRTLGGVSEVIYDEANHPPVLIHISSLVTGP